MVQLICASLSHTYYWYEVGMLKVSACVYMYGDTYIKNIDEPGKVVSLARGQMNKENEYFPVRVRALEFGLARRVRQSRPASAYSSPYSG